MRNTGGGGRRAPITVALDRGWGGGGGGGGGEDKESFVSGDGHLYIPKLQWNSPFTPEQCV